MSYVQVFFSVLILDVSKWFFFLFHRNVDLEAGIYYWTNKRYLQKQVWLKLHELSYLIGLNIGFWTA